MWVQLQAHWHTLLPYGHYKSPCLPPWALTSGHCQSTQQGQRENEGWGEQAQRDRVERVNSKSELVVAEEIVVNTTKRQRFRHCQAWTVLYPDKLIPLIKPYGNGNKCHPSSISCWVTLAPHTNCGIHSSSLLCHDVCILDLCKPKATWSKLTPPSPSRISLVLNKC